jgi:hypothetical protein
MTYVPTGWVDEVLPAGERYDLLTNAGGALYSQVQIKQHDVPTVAGTPVNAAAMLHIENAVAAILNTMMPNRNVIIDGGFTINQHVYVSGAALAAGVYGHDRWKAGAGGGNYSFTQLASPTTITIAASKTLIQVIENANVYGGTYILSWTGTCQARYAVNSATPAGAYAASPIVITGQTPGTTMSVEFGNGASSGTLCNVQLELGTVATPFEFRPFGQELALCQRYCYAHAIGSNQIIGIGCYYNASELSVSIKFPVNMRTAPSLLQNLTADIYSINCNGAQDAFGTFVSNFTSTTMADLYSITGVSGTSGYAGFVYTNNAICYLTFVAEL